MWTNHKNRKIGDDILYKGGDNFCRNVSVCVTVSK